MNKCKLICMSFDGEYQTEHPRDEDTFESVEKAWDWASDMGSRWFFYPFCFVVSASGETIKDAQFPLEFLIGKKVRTVMNLFEKTSKLPELKDADCDEFAFAVSNSLDL